MIEMKREREIREREKEREREWERGTATIHPRVLEHLSNDVYGQWHLWIYISPFIVLCLQWPTKVKKGLLIEL